MDTTQGERIPMRVFMVMTGILLALALLSVAGRMAIRFHFQGKLHSDDFVLMFACLTFIASQTLLYIFKIEKYYWLIKISYDPTKPENYAIILKDPDGFIRQALELQRIDAASACLTWATIFAVKICFLLFFYPLIIRLQRLLLAWKVIFGLTIFLGLFCISAIFISCPHFGPTSAKCSQGRGLIQEHSLVILGVILDIVSDLILISIPLILLWKANIQRQQKIFIGIFLCLSIVMIVIAIVRISGFLKNGQIDPVWILFWHQIEGAVAIIMVSMTAFRSMLGIKALKASEERRRERSWFSHHRKLRFRYFKKSSQDESKSEQLPSIPGATLTGMRTFINGSESWDESKVMGATHKSGEGWPIHASHESQGIEVAKLPTELDILDRVKSARTANFV